MTGLTPEELARYSRHLRLEEMGISGQTRLKNSRVLVIGAGGLGSPAALYLAAAGVGTLGIVDFDRVEPHNLQRQLLHTDSTVGELKTASAAARLRAANPLITVNEHATAVTASNAVALFSEYDVIVDGTDTFPTRYLNNDAAVLAQRPLVHGSIFRFEGTVSVFAPHLGGPCYRCLFSDPPPSGTVPTCEQAGVLGALCGIIGSLQAMEAIKLITGVGTPLIGSVLTCDALTQEFRRLRLAKSPSCRACGPGASLQEPIPAEPEACNNQSTPPMKAASAEAPLELSVEEVSNLLRTNPEGIALIDVRETYEAEICRIGCARLIPLRQLSDHLASLATDRHLLIYCHHGGRSLRATEFLRSRGFANVSNMRGGIDAWAERIEAGMRRY
ncbi:MAG: molybdopterin-synthase adenylyltransferase MoeB [Bryobacterales bacterium]|nr:molybdopterin-synthase adenylyltransferase MoeB [Opitutaceae bacterium]MCZ2152418.1 molybdopterin-synthase adenylyltransferase MoeB [Bryobacterales bacterium]